MNPHDMQPDWGECRATERAMDCHLFLRMHGFLTEKEGRQVVERIMQWRQEAIRQQLNESASSECRRCSECRDYSHHWMENGDFGNDDEPLEISQAEYVCKHCDELGRRCPICEGDCGDGVNLTEDNDCERCNGEGVIPFRAASEQEPRP